MHASAPLTVRGSLALVERFVRRGRDTMPRRKRPENRKSIHQRTVTIAEATQAKLEAHLTEISRLVRRIVRDMEVIAALEVLIVAKRNATYEGWDELRDRAQEMLKEVEELIPGISKVDAAVEADKLRHKQIRASRKSAGKGSKST